MKTDTSINRVPSIGASYLHFWAADLRRILQEIDKTKRCSTPEEIAAIGDQLGRLRGFCQGQELTPSLDDLGNASTDTSAPELIRRELIEYCDALRSEWARLRPNSQRRLRSILRHTLYRWERNEPEQDSVRWSEAVVAILCVVAWLTIFAVGYTVHAGPFDEVLSRPGHESLAAFCGALFMFILASIPTNVLILACIAGTLGTAYRRAKGSCADGFGPSKARDYMFAVTASFFVYIGLIAGLMTLTVADALTAETAEKQIQLAGTASICAFLVGYDRKILIGMLRRAAKLLMQADTPTRREQISRSAAATPQTTNGSVH